MSILKKIGKNKYLLLKTAMGVQLRGKKHPKIMHKIHFIKSLTNTYQEKKYEYGMINIGIIRTPKELMGERVKIIIEVLNNEQKS